VEPEAQRKVFGVAEGDEVYGCVLLQLPYGLLLELDEVPKDGFVAEADLLHGVQDYALGDEMKVEVQKLSWQGDIIVKQCAE